MYFGEILSKSVRVFSQNGVSENSASNSTSKYFILSLVAIFSVLLLSQNAPAQDYKYLALSSNLATETPTAKEQPGADNEKSSTEEVSTATETITRPRFVNRFYFPIKGVISSSFGENRRTHRHKGIDIAASPGTSIYPAAPGKVVFAGWQNGYGNTVIIEHYNGQLTRYAHALRLFVEVGEFVNSFDRIALVGSTGRSTGPHLHFELMDGYGQQLNPLNLLYKRPTPASETEEIDTTTVNNVAANLDSEGDE
jgi:murein DD-endopeptidase MepM/ murein hydrolase activator NlpD